MSLWVFEKYKRRKKGDSEKESKVEKANLIKPSRSLLTLTKEELVPYSNLKSLTELHVGFANTPMAMGCIEHYGQVKMVLKLEDGKTYLAGESVEQQKEQLTGGC